MQARNLTTKISKILVLKSSSKQIFSENCRWVPLTIIFQPNSATLVEQEDGKRTLLSMTNPNQREAIAKRLLTPSTGIKTVSPCKKVNTTIFNLK